MKRKIVAMLLVVSMVLGIFGLAAAVENNETAGFQAGAAKGVSGDVQEILSGVGAEGVLGEELPYGPPEFVESLKRAGVRYNIMARERVQIDGNSLKSDVPPVIIQDRILIPIRAVSNSLGADVEWDEEHQTITITRDGIVIIISIDNEEISINGTISAMDVKPQIFGSRTFVPLRFVAQALGDDVQWNQAAGEAMIRRNERAKQELEEEE